MTGAALDPPALFRFLAQSPDTKEVCIECGAGFGELAAFFAHYFDRVVATDQTPPKRPSPYGLEIIKAPAEQLPAADTSVDMVISMQSLHFFNVQEHLSEVRRVLRPGGVFAALSWGAIVLPGAVAQAYEATFRSLDPFWEPQRNWVTSGYGDLDFAETALPLPETAMSRQMTLPKLDAEIAGWSAVRRALTSNTQFEDPQLDALLLSDSDQFKVSWPIVGQAFKV